MVVIAARPTRPGTTFTKLARIVTAARIAGGMNTSTAGTPIAIGTTTITIAP